MKSVFARNIITRRKLRGWSQMALAQNANIGLTTLKEIETDKSTGWPGTKDAIARALNCSVDDLNQREPSIELEKINPQILDEIRELKKVVVEQKELNPTVRKIVDILSALNETQLKVGLTLIEGLKRDISVGQASLKKNKRVR